jgi:hypothetical protein
MRQSQKGNLCTGGFKSCDIRIGKGQRIRHTHATETWKLSGQGFTGKRARRYGHQLCMRMPE